MVVYKVTNILTGKSYIGQVSSKSMSIQQMLLYRFKRHCRKSSGCLALRDSIQKYGSENFEIHLIEQCRTQDELNLKEIELIKKFKTLVPNGYNLTLGGFGSSGRTVSELTKIKISKAHSGKVGLPSTRRKPIVCSNGKSYESIWGASTDLDIDRTKIRLVLDGKISQTKGYSFRYGKIT